MSTVQIQLRDALAVRLRAITSGNGEAFTFARVDTGHETTPTDSGYTPLAFVEYERTDYTSRTATGQVEPAATYNVYVGIKIAEGTDCEARASLASVAIQEAIETDPSVGGICIDCLPVSEELGESAEQGWYGMKLTLEATFYHNLGEAAG